MHLDPQFIRLFKEALGDADADRALAAFDSEPSVSVRLNSYKRPTAELPILEDSKKTDWSPEGFLLAKRPVFTLHPLFHAGAYYVQDSSAMFVGELVSRCLSSDRSDIVRVLDLCAAPGGKTTDLSNRLRRLYGERFLLVSNEVMRNRATVLSDNVARWGDPNVVVTSVDPKAFSGFDGFFDLILADVPCSGEGMFRKDEEALTQWSQSNVELCASRQRRIVADVWPSLKDGGVFVYSTCTFNRYENDGNVGWICSELGASPLKPTMDFSGPLQTEYGWSLVPGLVPGEGQYCAAVVKSGGKTMPVRDVNRQKFTRHIPQDWFTIPFEERVCREKVIAVPQIISREIDCIASKIPLLLSGCAAGTLKGNTLIPDEDMALSIAFNGNAFPAADLDKQQALAFLHRDSLNLPAFPKSYLQVKYKGLPLGFVKNLGNRCNNLHPLNRRIRMDI